ncbi:helix-turn-helix domain-containing protein, partial [Archangium violaceum]|uniref:helix-turn-helix domain-containing protein n=1 Tax=Archangium violaceum TaxID=83451 RepID=UPI0013642F94
MPWHPRQLTTEQLEERRLAAAKLLEKGYSQVDVARKIGVSPASVCYWAKALKP